MVVPGARDAEQDSINGEPSRERVPSLSLDEMVREMIYHQQEVLQTVNRMLDVVVVMMDRLNALTQDDEDHEEQTLSGRRIRG